MQGTKVELQLEVLRLRNRLEMARLKEIHLLDQVLALNEKVSEYRATIEELQQRAFQPPAATD